MLRMWWKRKKLSRKEKPRRIAKQFLKRRMLILRVWWKRKKLSRKMMPRRIAKQFFKRKMLILRAERSLV